MSATELPCMWAQAGQAGQELLAAMTAHLPREVAITARVLGDEAMIMDPDAAVWCLEGAQVTRVATTAQGWAELTTWRAGREVDRQVVRGPSS